MLVGTSPHIECFIESGLGLNDAKKQVSSR